MRSSTGVSSPVTGSKVSELAVSEAVPDGQKGWRVVKRKQRGRRQAGGQSRKLNTEQPGQEKVRNPRNK